MQLDAIAAKNFPIQDGEARVPDEVVAIDRLTFASWGGGLTLPQYLARERRLRGCAYSRGLVQWVLREGSELLASCETYAVPFVHSAPDGTRRREGLGHGVASVYVEERLRGKGYASILLQRIHERLRGEGALCMYLMSEIGPTLYERLGYVSRPLRICRFAAADPAREAPRHQTWRWLTEAEVPSLLGKPAKEMFSKPRTGLWIDTPAAQLDWHLQRGHFYAQALGRKRAVHVGAESGASLALWQPDYVRSVLNMILLWPGSAYFPSRAARSARQPGRGLPQRAAGRARRGLGPRPRQRRDLGDPAQRHVPARRRPERGQGAPDDPPAGPRHPGRRVDRLRAGPLDLIGSRLPRTPSL